MLTIDGAQGEGGGQVLRTALALSAATGQPFTMTRIRAGRVRPGLRPQHTAAVRAAALICGARTGGVFDGSPDLRFEPGPLSAGEFRFEIATSGSLTLLLQTVLLPLALARSQSRVEVTGGTHVTASPSFHFVSRHWASVLERFGIRMKLTLVRAGFYPPGGGECHAVIEPWQGSDGLSLDDRGEFLEIRGLSGAAKVKGDVARRQSETARSRLWEARRLESTWDVVEVPAQSPGSFLLIEAVFERGRAAFGFLGERGVRAESLGDRAGRTLLTFLETEAAVDPCLADQLALPLALSERGGRVTTTHVTRHLQTVASVIAQFGIPARTFGHPGGPGGLEIEGRGATRIVEDKTPPSSI